MPKHALLDDDRKALLRQIDYEDVIADFASA
jgi:hypothetical protein